MSAEAELLHRWQSDTLPADWQVQACGDSCWRLEQPTSNPLRLKQHPSANAAQREFGVLNALRDFGINIAPKPLAVDGVLLLTEWLGGEPLQTPPEPANELRWHQMMAAMGAAAEMDYARFTAQVPMLGTGYQNPLDLMLEIDQKIEALGEDHPDYERLVDLTNAIGERVAPEWNDAPPIGLCRQNYALQDFIWDGHHMLTLNWAQADWGDIAADIGLWSAHPDYEALPATHWTWLRWEFARLTRDKSLPARAAVYSQLGQMWWAVTLCTSDIDPARRKRYLARAEKLFLS